MEQFEKNYPSDYKVVFESDKGKLYLKDLSDTMVDRDTGRINENPVATPGGSDSVLIDERAYHILKDRCGDDKEGLDRYLAAILNFELHHSADEQRHRDRLPIEKDILDILEEGGYFGDSE